MVGCRLYPYNCIKRKLHYIRFSNNFPKFLTHFKKSSWNHHWRSLAGFWPVDYSPVLNCDYIKSDSIRNNFLKFFVDLFPQKSVWWIPVLVATSNISKCIFVHRPYSSGYCEKIFCSKHLVVVFYFSKNDSICGLSEPGSEIRCLSKAFYWKHSVHLVTSKKCFGIESLFIAIL